MLPSSIRITDVGPRDGLQNEKGVIETADKIEFINRLAASGVAEVEATSFVSPKWVPQLGDAAEVLAGITPVENVVYSALVPNMKGFERAAECGVRKIAVFASASESFAQKNTNGSVNEVIDRFIPVVEAAKKENMTVRGYISCIVACPYEGEIDADDVTRVAERLLDIGIDEIDLGETIGVAAPKDIDILYQQLSRVIPPKYTTLHLHDTRGSALACAFRAMQLGVRSFDSSCGGLGGCPYAPGASGNLATEDLVYMCQRLGVETNVDLAKLFDAAGYIAARLGRSLPGRVFAADGNSSTCGT